jgi:hypothetical protein
MSILQVVAKWSLAENLFDQGRFWQAKLASKCRFFGVFGIFPAKPSRRRLSTPSVSVRRLIRLGGENRAIKLTAWRF